MIYLVATISAVVTGGLLALLVRVMASVEHQGILLAVGIFGGAIQWLVLLGWYLHHTRPKV
jgi:hypothetical protein